MQYVMYLYEMKWIELYVDSSCPVCNKWLNLNRSEESLHGANKVGYLRKSASSVYKWLGKR